MPKEPKKPVDQRELGGSPTRERFKVKVTGTADEPEERFGKPLSEEEMERRYEEKQLHDGLVARVSDATRPLTNPYHSPEQKAAVIRYFLNPSDEAHVQLLRLFPPKPVEGGVKNVADDITQRLRTARKLLGMALAGADVTQHGEPKDVERTSLDEREAKVSVFLSPFTGMLTTANDVTPKLKEEAVLALIRNLQVYGAERGKRKLGLDISSGLYRIGLDLSRAEGTRKTGISIVPVKGNEQVGTYDSHAVIPASEMEETQSLKSVAVNNYINHGQHLTVSGPEQSVDYMTSLGSPRNVVTQNLLRRMYVTFHRDPRRDAYTYGVYFTVPPEARTGSSPSVALAPFVALKASLIQLALMRYGKPLTK